MSSYRYKAPPPDCSDMQGMTLVEATVVMSILATLAAVAAPGVSDMMTNRRLEGRARDYVTHLNWARSLAVSSNQAVNLRVSDVENASCYLVFHGPVSDCSCSATSSSCATPGNAALMVVHIPNSEGIKVKAKTLSEITRIDPTQGTLTPTLTAVFTADNGKEIHNISNIMGRTRSCMPGTASFGFKSC